MNEIDYDASRNKLQIAIQNRRSLKYEKVEICPSCGGQMRYIYGEMYECMTCGRKELTEFGKVRQFLDQHGPQNADTISEATGVSVKRINEFLREGRVEIPDGSEVYIKCQSCGTDIRYGRYCPECMMKLTNGLAKAVWMPEVGEKPTNKNIKGKMHLSELQNEQLRKKSAFKRMTNVHKDDSKQW